MEALGRFASAFRDGAYERGRGRMSGWLLGIARHCVRDVQRRRGRLRERHGASAVADLPADDELTVAWEAERERVEKER